MINLKKNYALILALGLMLTGCTGQTGTDETKATQAQQIATSGTEETVEPSPSADITTVDVQTTENKTEEDTTAEKETTDQETESEDESTAEETTAEEPTAEETEEPTAEEETTPENTAEPTTAEPTTPEPTTAEPTTPEPTTPEPTTVAPTTPEPTTPAPTTPAPTEPTTAEPATTQPIVIVKAVKIEGSVSGTHYIGDTLSGADFTIKVTMSDGNVLTNPAGWAAAPLQLSAASNVITIAYADVSTQITVNASERPAPPTVSDNLGTVYTGDEMLAYTISTFIDGHTTKSMSFAGEAIYLSKDYPYGKPYVCSNFVQAVFAKFGMSIPGSVEGIYNLDKTSAHVREIPVSEAQAGDIAVTLYNTGSYTGHVGIVVKAKGDMVYCLDSTPEHGIGTSTWYNMKILRFSGNTLQKTLVWNNNIDLPGTERIVTYNDIPTDKAEGSYVVKAGNSGTWSWPEYTRYWKIDKTLGLLWEKQSHEPGILYIYRINNDIDISSLGTSFDYSDCPDFDGSRIEPGEYNTVDAKTNTGGTIVYTEKIYPY